MAPAAWLLRAFARRHGQDPHIGSALGSTERAGAKSKLEVTLDVVGYEEEGKGFWQGLIAVRVWDPMTGWMAVAEARPDEPLQLDLLPEATPRRSAA